MPRPHVTKVTFTGGKILLTVELEEFMAGRSVEISGYATQNSGGFATFYDTQTVTATRDGTVIAYVEATSSNGFKNGEDVTASMRASIVWSTVLTGPAGQTWTPGQPATPEKETPIQDGATWDTIRAEWPALEQRDGNLPAVIPVSPPYSRPGTRSAGTGLYHGTWWDQWDWSQPDSHDTVMAGRFTTLLPGLSPAAFDLADLRQLADEMTPKQERRPTHKTGLDPGEDPAITAAYTYLGQFADHDLTFDPTSRLRESLDREQIGKLADFRTPRFDLDNLYGRGPDDQPYMYDRDGIRMLPGEPLSGNPHDPHAVQVPRGPNGRALIGDPRDDENRIVSQLHAIFLRFHNQVADHIGKKAGFQEIREQVRWHYQWVLVRDFLPTIIDSETYGRVFGDPYSPVPGLRRLRTGLRLMPVEFSVAAYRFGHSMIRTEYRLNTAIERPIFARNSDDTADLGGFRPIPDGWAIDWNFFIHLEPSARPQHAFKIDTSLASPLRRLPRPDRRQPLDAGASQPRTRQHLRPSLRPGRGQGTWRGPDPRRQADDRKGDRRGSPAAPRGHRRPVSPARPPCGRTSCPRHRSRPGRRPTPAFRAMTSPSSSGPWGAGSSPMSSPPCSSATPRPTFTRTLRSGRSRSSAATEGSVSPS